MTNDPLTRRKLARSAAGLAPEDETFEQAQNTGRLRQDPTYIERWVRHEEGLDITTPRPIDVWAPAVQRAALWGVG